MLENEKQNRDTSRKVDNKWGTEEAMDISNSGLHHEVNISSRKGYNIGSMW